CVYMFREGYPIPNTRQALNPDGSLGPQPLQTLDRGPDRKDHPMRVLRPLFLLLVIVGGLNWLLVALFKVALVAALTGNTFGETSVLSSIVYVLVGISAIGLIPTLV